MNDWIAASYAITAPTAGYLDVAVGTTEKSVVTDIFGNWSLTGLFAGTYIVRVLPVTGILPTKPTGAVVTIHLTPGQSSSGIQFGERPIS